MVKTHSSQTDPRKRGRPPKSSGDASIGIRKAALKAFALAGFNGVSIVKIAQMAGVAKPLVHYHYASKDVLWEAAVGEAVADLAAEIEQFRAAFFPTNSPPELLRMVARQLVLFASRHPGSCQRKYAISRHFDAIPRQWILRSHYGGLG